jgi:four helix bundle protein
MRFDHEKLDVYNASIELVVLINKMIENLPKGRAYLADQFQRAGASVPLNIAEGAGEFATQEKIRFYRMAKRSATECSAILDICARLDLVGEVEFNHCKSMLVRIVSMLIKMAKTTE